MHKIFLKQKHIDRILFLKDLNLTGRNDDYSN
jgi:hypothetical protein